MKRAILSFFTFSLLCTYTTTAQEMTPEMSAFLAKIDGASLADIEAELDEGLKGLKAFSGFFDGGDSEGIKDYSNEEERFEPPFKIDTSVVAKALLQFDNIGFQQSFRNGKSQLKFQKIGNDYWNTVWMEDGMAESYRPKAIYYKDGTTLTEGISENEMSFFFENPWGDIAVIDSIAFDYTINYTAEYDSLLLTKKSKKIKFKEGLIKVQKIEQNFLYLTISDGYADGLYVNALNAEGKILNQNSSSFSPTTDDQAGDGIAEIVHLLEEVQSKLKKKAFKDTAAFKSYLLKKAAQIEEAKDTDGVYHKKYYFEGNIETVKILIETKEKSKTVSFTATNNSDFGDIILMQSKTHNIFLDANAKELFKLDYSPIQSLGSRYFQNDSLYYHLNLEAQNLDELEVLHVWEAPNGLTFIKTDIEHKHRMYSSEHELLSDIEFDDLYKIDKEYVQGISNKENYILGPTGDIKKLEGITGIRDAFDGRMAATSNGKYGFLDTSGEIVIPFEYTEVENFNEGLAIVANEDYKYGLIDTNGKTVIPLIYSKILSNENGIAWVETEDSYQLIDKTAKVLATEQGGSYSINRSGNETTYQFGDKKYNAYGKLIPKAEEEKN